MSAGRAVRRAARRPTGAVGRRATRAAAAAATLAALLGGCATTRAPLSEAEVAAAVARGSATSLFGPAADFVPSPDPAVAYEALAPVHGPDECEVAVLASGADSLAARLASLERARTSIRIQALVFKGDEAGLRIAAVLKRRKAEGIDVRIVVDAFSNPWLQTQWLYFDLKQHGIEVQGYEALALQWLNEVPVPLLTAHRDRKHPDHRSHEKLWIVDGETADGYAITGGMNVGNEYFQVDDENPSGHWRDQDVALRGAVVRDLVAAFDRNFEHFVRVKRSRGALDTDRYWAATRRALETTGRVPVHYGTERRLVERVDRLAERQVEHDWRPATCRFFHSRPRAGETYLSQAYLQLIAAARSELLIANAYFVPTPAIRAALAEAAARCVVITLLTNGPETNDLPEISLVGRGYYRRLLEADARARPAHCAGDSAELRIYEWTGVAPDDPVRSGTMHAKFAVVDRRVSLVGSYNLDPRSERLNSETAIVFEDAPLGAELARSVVERDLRYARRVTPADADRYESPPGIVERFRRRLGTAFEDEL